MGGENGINPDSLINAGLVPGKSFKGPKNGHKLTEGQIANIAKALSKYKETHGGMNVKYGANLEGTPEFTLPDGGMNVKYGANIDCGGGLPDGGMNVKYGANLDLNPPPVPKYGLNCGLGDGGTNVKYGANLGK